MLEPSTMRRPLQTCFHTNFWSNVSYHWTHLTAYVQKDVCDTLAKALPRTVQLAVTIPGQLDPALRLALQQPAPHLRSFKFDRVESIGYSECTQLYDNIFDGYAPRLRAAALFNAVPSPIGSPAWTNVRSLMLDFASESPVAHLSALFPNLRRLVVILRPCNGTPSCGSVANLNLRGLKLARLHMESYLRDRSVFNPLRAQIDMANIDTVTCAPFGWVDDKLGFWEVFKDGCNSYVPLRMTACGHIHDAQIQTTILCMRPDSESRNRTRALLFPATYIPEDAMSGLPSALIVRIVSMHLSLDTLKLLLEFSRSLHSRSAPLSNLKMLTVRIHTLDGSGSNSRDRGRVPLWDHAVLRLASLSLHCPRLDSVRLYARPDSKDNTFPTPSSTPNTLNVPLGDLVFLGHVIGQMDRDEDQRARLELQGVGFARTKGMDSDMRSLLEDCFPRIVHMAVDNDVLPPPDIDAIVDELG